MYTVHITWMLPASRVLTVAALLRVLVPPPLVAVIVTVTSL